MSKGFYLVQWGAEICTVVWTPCGGDVSKVAVYWPDDWSKKWIGNGFLPCPSPLVLLSTTGCQWYWLQIHSGGRDSPNCMDGLTNMKLKNRKFIDQKNSLKSPKGMISYHALLPPIWYYCQWQGIHVAGFKFLLGMGISPVAWTLQQQCK